MVTYSFAATRPWVDIALQIPQHIRWTPECGNPHDLNIEKKLSPAYTHNGLQIWGQDGNWHTRGKEEELDSQDGITIYVEVGVAVIDNVGATARVITTGRSLFYRRLFIHGRVTTKEPPVYRQEAAVLHGWILASNGVSRPPRNIRKKAGCNKTINKIAQW